MSAGTLAAARRRHPSARWPAPADALRQRMAQLLDLRGAAHPDVAAALLQARGRLGLDVPVFAERLGVDVDLVRRAEAGEIGVAQLPGPLRRVMRSE